MILGLIKAASWLCSTYWRDSCHLMKSKPVSNLNLLLLYFYCQNEVWHILSSRSRLKCLGQLAAANSPWPACCQFTTTKSSLPTQHRDNSTWPTCHKDHSPRAARGRASWAGKWVGGQSTECIGAGIGEAAARGYPFSYIQLLPLPRWALSLAWIRH